MKKANNNLLTKPLNQTKMTNTAETKQKSNNLIYRTDFIRGEEHYYIKIRLNDECNNGHQDFTITGDIYKAGKPKIDKYIISCGAIGDRISKIAPRYAIFNKLHLCDWEGVPTYAVSNGFYHITNGFNNTKPEDKNFKAEFCEYYRITPEQFNVLSQCRNELQYALQLDKLRILKQWKEEANKAIQILEELTGIDFLPDSSKSNYHAPTDEELKEEDEKIKSGYYTPEAEAQREADKLGGLIAELEAERDKEMLKHSIEFEVKKEVVIKGGEKALDNCIFYEHTNTLSFNWKSYDRLSNEFLNALVNKLKLPNGVIVQF